MTCLIFYIFIRYKKPFYVSYNKEYTVKKNKTVRSIYEQKCQITAKYTTKVRKIIIVSKHLQKYLLLMPDYSEAGEGNGTPLQCSCLENPRDGGAW